MHFRTYIYVCGRKVVKTTSSEVFWNYWKENWILLPFYPLALANLCCFSFYRISCLSRRELILCKIGLTNLHDFYGWWHLYICSVRSLDLLAWKFCRFNRVYEGHFMLCYSAEFSQNFKPLSACRFVESDTSVICHVLVFCFGSFLLQVSCSYLIELMFLELDVWVYSSFDRSGTTGLKYSSLRASLLTASLNNVLNVHVHHL